MQTHKVRNKLAVRLPRRGEDLLPCRLWLAIRNIVRNGATEKHRFLSDIPNLPPQLLRIHLPDILAIDLDRTLVWVIESQQQASNCTLASTRRRDNGNIAAVRDRERQIFEYLDCGPGGVGEGDALEINVALSFDDWLAFRWADGCLSVLQLEQS